MIDSTYPLVRLDDYAGHSSDVGRPVQHHGAAPVHYGEPAKGPPVKEVDIWALMQSVAAATPVSRFVCAGCWNGVEQEQTECYSCGAELHTHPQDEHREPWHE